MKLRNKKTGEIVEPFGISCVNGRTFVQFDDNNGTIKFVAHSLAELNSEWEDVPEEPKEHWCITMYGGITRIKDDEEPIDDLIEIGNYFNSKEDAYDAWDKLKAWKRLKDKGFKISLKKESNIGYLEANWQVLQGDYSDVDICFGGEE